MVLLKALKDYGFRSRNQSYTDTDYLIMASFFPENKASTPPQVVEKTGFSYETVHSILNKLAERKQLKKEIVGRTQQFTLDTKNTHSFIAYMQYCMFKNTDFATKNKTAYKMLREFAEETDPMLALVYGSYAKHVQTRESDLDLLVVDSKMRPRMKEMPNYRKQTQAMESKYGVKTHLLHMEYLDFLEVQKHNSLLWETMRDDGVVIHGYNEAFIAFYK
jgi:predicted nucleotidyltransferase